MGKELRNVIHSNRISLAILTLFIVIFAICSSFGGQKTLIPLLEETKFSMTDLEGNVHSFAYADIKNIELRKGLSNFNRGELIDGIETRTYFSGTYSNDEFGEYQLLVKRKISTFIVVYLPEKIIVLNYESDDTTEMLYKSFTEDITQ